MAREGATSGRSGSGSVAKPKHGNAITNLNSIIGRINTNFANTYKAPTYKAPTYTPQPAAQTWAAPAAPAYGGGGYTGGYGGGVGTGGNAGYSAPIAAPEPPKERYSMDDPNKRIASVDSTFRGQESMYNESLKKFIEDIGRRKTTLELDTKEARAGIGRNKEIGMTSMGEDFASRGLGHSGLWVDAQAKGRDAYKRQDDNVIAAEKTGIADLNFSKTKETADNTARVQAAKRDALYRLQLKNNIVEGL